MNSDDLPQRRPQGYKITALRLEIKTSPELAERIQKEIQLPKPPDGKLNEMALVVFMRDYLRPHARAALALLKTHESDRAKRGYKSPQDERVRILVCSGGLQIGIVDGEGRVYDARGKLYGPRASSSSRINRPGGPRRNYGNKQ